MISSPCLLLQGDACALPANLGKFNAVLAANLLCRVPDPAACLAEMDAALNPGGLLVLTSPFTWLEEYTAKSRWLGATYDAQGKPRRCADALKEKLGDMGYEVLDEGKVS
jgi:SAM-dependent methyltransferase